MPGWIGRRNVPIRAFDATTRRWEQHSVSQGDVVSQDDGTGDAVMLATFNVWFDPRHAITRYRAIADLLRREMPDVMVFQEMTARAVDVLLGEDWIRERYSCAGVTGHRVGNYGQLMLARVPIRRAVYVRLPTRAARGVLRAEVNVGGQPLVVGSVHLDSGKTAVRLRERQLRRTFGEVDGMPDVVLLGDFNMRDAENAGIAAPFVDVWPRLRPNEPGYTEDTSINVMRLDSTGKERHVRFDRVLIKGNGWRPTQIDLLGTKPISPDLPRVFPSDHLGVICRVERSSG